MSDPAHPLVDFAAETALGAADILVIAGAGALALATFAVVLWRDRERTKSCEYQPGTCADMTVC